MECYLRDSAELLHTQFPKSFAVYEKYYCPAILENVRKFHEWETANPEVLLNVHICGPSATAITKTSNLVVKEGQSRYLLTLTEGDWRITRKDERCLPCQGSGRIGGCVCGVCNGEGWLQGKQNED